MPPRAGQHADHLTAGHHLAPVHPGHDRLVGRAHVGVVDRHHTAARDHPGDRDHPVRRRQHHAAGRGGQVDPAMAGRPPMRPDGESAEHRVRCGNRPHPAPGRCDRTRLRGHVVGPRGRRRRGRTGVDHRGGPPGWRARDRAHQTALAGAPGCGAHGSPREDGSGDHSGEESSNGHAPTLDAGVGRVQGSLSTCGRRDDHGRRGTQRRPECEPAPSLGRWPGRVMAKRGVPTSPGKL